MGDISDVVIRCTQRENDGDVNAVIINLYTKQIIEEKR